MKARSVAGAHTGRSSRLTGDVVGRALGLRDPLVAAADKGDVIVMSSHGRTGIKRWFLGSVAEEVMRHANCPVLLHRAEGAPVAS